MCMCAFRNVAKELFPAHALCSSIHHRVNLLYIEGYISCHSLQSRATLSSKVGLQHIWRMKTTSQRTLVTAECFKAGTKGGAPGLPAGISALRCTCIALCWGLPGAAESRASSWKAAQVLRKQISLLNIICVPHSFWFKDLEAIWFQPQHAYNGVVSYL